MKVYSLIELNESAMQNVEAYEEEKKQLTYLTGHKLFASCFDETDNSFVIPEGFEHITEYGLDAYKERMECLVIPKSLVSIENNAFSQCGKLKEIRVREGNAVFFILNDALYKRDTYEAIWEPPVDSEDMKKMSYTELKKENIMLKKRIQVLEKYIRMIKGI